jgi:hypothetical protein
VNTTATAADRFVALSCRVSRRLFEVCGQGASRAAPELAAALAPLAGMFAWHAELLYDVLPVRAGIDRDTLVDEGADGADEAMDLLDELVASKDSAALRSSLTLVVDWLEVHVARERHSVEPLLEGPRARAFTLIARDLDDVSTTLDSIATRLTHDAAPSAGSLEAVVRVGAALGASSASGAEAPRTSRLEGLTAPVE